MRGECRPVADEWRMMSVALFRHIGVHRGQVIIQRIKAFRAVEKV